MSILDYFRRQKAAPLPFVASVGMLEIPAGINQRDYLAFYGQVGWLFAAVSRIAESVSDNEWHLMRVQGGTSKEVFASPVLDLMEFVNPFMTGGELIEIHQMYMELVGESFWWINRGESGTGRPTEIWPISPVDMRVIADQRKFVSGYVFKRGAELIPLAVTEVIHIKRSNPINPYRGVGPAQSIGVDLQTENLAARYNRDFFYNSATPRMVVSYPDDLSADEHQRMVAQWNKSYRGTGNAHKTAIIGSGAKIDTVTVSQKDMEFWKQRKLNRDNILGAFGIPQTILGVTENVNLANAESGERVFAKEVIKPRLSRLRNKLNEQLLPMFGAASRGLKLQFEDPVPANRAFALQEATEGVKGSILTVNEGRALIQQDKIPGGDVILIPMNLIPMPTSDKVMVMPAPAASPKQLSRRLSIVKYLDDDEQKATWWQRYVDIAEGQEKPIQAGAIAVFDKLEQITLEKLQTARKPSDALPSQKQGAEMFKKALFPLLEKVMGDAILAADGLVRPENPHTDMLKQETPVVSGDALEWLVNHSATLVKGLMETTRQELRGALADGFAEGEGMPKLAARVRTVMADATRRRSIVIARTEVIAASAQGHIEGYKTNGIRKVEFMAALDDRVDDECEALDKQEFSAASAEGMIPIHPMCRCVWIPVV